MSIVELFCDVDDFCQSWACYGLPLQLGPAKRGPKHSLGLSEIMTLMIHFHQSPSRDFKAYSIEPVLKHLRA
jgi:hypothetical protein